jgi:hypothetical protein
MFIHNNLAAVTCLRFQLIVTRFIHFYKSFELVTLQYRDVKKKLIWSSNFSYLPSHICHEALACRAPLSLWHRIARFSSFHRSLPLQNIQGREKPIDQKQSLQET